MKNPALNNFKLDFLRWCNAIYLNALITGRGLSSVREVLSTTHKSKCSSWVDWESCSNINIRTARCLLCGYSWKLCQCKYSFHCNEV